MARILIKYKHALILLILIITDVSFTLEFILNGLNYYSVTKLLSSKQKPVGRHRVHGLMAGELELVTCT